MSPKELYKKMRELADAAAGQDFVEIPYDLAHQWSALACMYPGVPTNNSTRMMTLKRLEASFVDAEANIAYQTAQMFAKND